MSALQTMGEFENIQASEETVEMTVSYVSRVFSWNSFHLER